MHRLLAPLAITCALAATAHADDPRAAEPRLLGFSAEGLSAGTSSLFAGKVDAAIYDPAQDLIWFVTSGNLEVLDLRDTGAKPVVIAKKFPTGLAFAITGASNGDFETMYAGIYPILHVDKKPRITTGEGAEYENWFNIDADAKKKIKRIKVVGKAWLKKQAKRKANPVAKATAAELPHAKLPEGTCQDDAEGDDCGTASAIGGSGYQLVLIEASCGDACFQECLAYDPASGKLASPAVDSKWVKPPPGDDVTRVPCDEALHPDGDRGVYYVTSTSDSDAPADPLCTIGKDGVHCQSAPGWRFFGWLPAAAQ